MDRQLALAGADDRVGEAVGTRRAEVGVEEVAAVGVDVGDRRGRVGGRPAPWRCPGSRRPRWRGTGRWPGCRAGGSGKTGAAAEVGVGADGAGRTATSRSPARPRDERASDLTHPGVVNVGYAPHVLRSSRDLELVDLELADGRLPIVRRPTLSRPIAKPPTRRRRRRALRCASRRGPASGRLAGRASGRKKAIPAAASPQTVARLAWGADERGRAADPAGDPARAVGGPAPDPRCLRRPRRAHGQTAGGPGRCPITTMSPAPW